MAGTSVCMPWVPALLRLTAPSQGDPTQCHHLSLQHDEPGKELSGELKSLKGQSPTEHQSRLRTRTALQASTKLAKPPLVYPVGSARVWVAAGGAPCHPGASEPRAPGQAGELWACHGS